MTVRQAIEAVLSDPGPIPHPSNEGQATGAACSSRIECNEKALCHARNPLSGNPYAGQHSEQPRLTRLLLHRGTAMSLLQAITRVKQTFIEQRRSIREHVHFPAWIDIGNGSQPRDCIVLDVSEGGFGIMISSPAELPPEFWLILTEQGTIRCRCRIVWRTGEQIGVTCLGSPQAVVA